MAEPNTRDHEYEDEGLWVVGFDARYLGAANLMSGLVDIVDVRTDVQHGAVLFIVKNLDKTGCLFKTGSLKARKIDKWDALPQPVLME